MEASDSLKPNSFPRDQQCQGRILVPECQQNPTLKGSLPRAEGRTELKNHAQDLPLASLVLLELHSGDTISAAASPH